MDNITELFDIKKDDFKMWNDELSSDDVKAGKEYIIKKNKDSFTFEEYFVKSGETLNKISKDNQVDVEDLQNCNGITNPNNIKPDQQLIIITKK